MEGAGIGCRRREWFLMVSVRIKDEAEKSGWVKSTERKHYLGPS